METTKPPSNNKFNVNLDEYDQHSSRHYAARSRPSGNTGAHSRSGVANRSHGESPRSFKTVESTMKKDAGVESYLQQKLSKAQQDRRFVDGNRDAKKQSRSPKDKKPELERTSEKEDAAKEERLDWSAMCENSTELMEREAKAKGISLSELETEAQNTRPTLQDSAVSNSTNLDAENASKASGDSVEEVGGHNEKKETPEEEASTGEVAEEEDEEWEDLSDEEDKKKSKKKTGRNYGGYYGRY